MQSEQLCVAGTASGPEVMKEHEICFAHKSQDTDIYFLTYFMLNSAELA